jgi:hypothetical protein
LDGTEKVALGAVAQRVRASGALGRSPAMHRLFDYLLERTLGGDSPREVEIATDVFGRSDDDLLDDASVRVYVHRLRRKLDEHYAGPGADEAERLVLPKGDYRFQVERNEPPVGDPGDAMAADAIAAAVAASAATRHAWARRAWLFLIAGLFAGGLAMFAGLRLFAPADALAQVRASPLWQPLVSASRPLTIVTGDYYIMGERDRPGADPTRLVREFSVNSREELDELLMRRPDLRDRYVDLNLTYLPVSAAYALKAIMPVLTPGLSQRSGVPFVLTSKLAPAQFKDGDLVYVGLLSGLGLLQQPVFSGSRFNLGWSFDQLIDSKSGKLYVADPPGEASSARRNYAYVAMLPGPNGNHILIVAGTRDPALLQAADILTDPAELARLAAASKDGYFEALYAVDGVGDENLKGTLIAASPRKAEGLWDGMLDLPVEAAPAR